MLSTIAVAAMFTHFGIWQRQNVRTQSYAMNGLDIPLVLWSDFLN